MAAHVVVLISISIVVSTTATSTPYSVPVQQPLGKIASVSNKLSSNGDGSSDQLPNARVHASQVGFSRGFGRVLGINIYGEELSHQSGFSKQYYSFMGDNHHVLDGFFLTIIHF